MRAMKRLAELYDARGGPAKAAAVRRRLVKLWRRTNPEFQAVIAQIRARLSG